MIDINDIEKQVQEALKQKIDTELANYDLYTVIEQQINRTVQDKVNATITGLLNRLINSETIAQQVDALVTTELQEKVDLAVKSRAAQTVSQVDLGTEISKRIAGFVEERMLQAKLPENFIPASSINWNNSKLSADFVGSGTIQDFTSRGIEDCASDINLTVLDGQVVVENELVSTHITVVGNANIKNLSADNITVGKITVNDSSFVESIKGLIDNRISQQMNNSDIDLIGKPLKSNNQVILDHKSLGNSIVESNLRKVGRLTTLSVIGETELAETLYINNGKLGVNTDEPAGVFTAWDEESELTIRKYKNRTMYIGSTRDSELVLGVAGDAVVAVRKDGIETNKVKIGNINITSSTKQPVYRGAPGDLVINCGTEKAWAWRCTGGETWIALN